MKYNPEKWKAIFYLLVCAIVIQKYATEKLFTWYKISQNEHGNENISHNSIVQEN
jgi:hypothetical protein